MALQSDIEEYGDLGTGRLTAAEQYSVQEVHLSCSWRYASQCFATMSSHKRCWQKQPLEICSVSKDLGRHSAARSIEALYKRHTGIDQAHSGPLLALCTN